MNSRTGLHILLVEDVMADAALIRHELRRGGFSFEATRVESRDDFLQQVQRHPPDLILSDHGLPTFDGFTALALAQERCPETPFIFVSGSVGEELAIESLRRGAVDYVSKLRLRGLVPAVQRALRLRDERQRRRQAEEDLRQSEERYRCLVELSPDALLVLRYQRVTFVNTAAQSLFGAARTDQLLGMPLPDLVHPGHRESVCGYLEALPPHGRAPGRTAAGPRPAVREATLLRLDGAPVAVELAAARLTYKAAPAVQVIVHDLSERKEAELALRQSEARKTAILETAGDAVVSVDHQGGILEWNGAAERMFGRRRADVVGTVLSNWLLQTDAGAGGTPAPALAGILPRGQGWALGRPVELTGQRADGRQFPVEITVTRVPGEPEPTFTAFIRDITRRQRVERVLRQSRDRFRRLNAELEQRVEHRTAELQRAYREMEAFSYSVSHDLRAPLIQISGFAELLELEALGGLGETAQHYLHTIRESTRRMSEMIDGLLSLSRMSRAEMHKVSVVLDNLASSVIETFRSELADRRIEWVIPPLPAVHGDPTLLRQVLVNLLSNALKYTRHRPVARIELGAQIHPAETVLFVRDNGVGFDMRYADKLFQVFQRLHRAAEFEGTGIGLANVRRIIERHGGRVWAEGAPDHGATFSISLPHPPAAPQSFDPGL